MLAYVIACIGEFARAAELTAQDAYRYLEQHEGIDFLIDYYDTEHLLSLQDAVEDLMIIAKNSEGAKA